jgi:acetyl-CoA carboxylase biotin carboxyl carrier protein
MNEKLLLTLLDKFNDGKAAEMDLDDGTTRLILRKESVFVRNSPGSVRTTPPAAPEQSAPAENTVHLGLPVNIPQGETAGGLPAAVSVVITSPIVATFYPAPGPDVPPFVRPGKKVRAGETLCILEAMKMMNHLEAEFDCEILAVKAASGDLVEYGQILFEVKRL